MTYAIKSYSAKKLYQQQIPVLMTSFIFYNLVYPSPSVP